MAKSPASATNLCFVVGDHRARLSIDRQEEESLGTATLPVLDVVGWEYQSDVKNTHSTYTAINSKQYLVLMKHYQQF